MRKLIVVNLVTLDGYFEGPEKNFMAMPLHPVFDTYNAERLDAAETLVLGGTTYRMFSGFWPAADNPEITGDTRRIARRTAEVGKLVVSASITPDDLVDWGSPTEVIDPARAADRINELKSGDGGDLVVFGSGRLTNELIAAGLVDEIHLMVGPAVLAGGTPMFTAPVSGLRLIGARTFDGTDHVVLQYAVAPTDA